MKRIHLKLLSRIMGIIHAAKAIKLAIDSVREAAGILQQSSGTGRPAKITQALSFFSDK